LMKLAIIGGSGLYALGLGPTVVSHSIKTPFAADPVLISEERVGAASVLFLARHGANHSTPPHLINYRANLWALHALGATQVIAVNAVGGISPGMTPGCLVIPDQVIDYTWGREHTFVGSEHHFVGSGSNVLAQHVDFTEPYNATLRQQLVRSAKVIQAEVRTAGVYGCTQGPRLETAAEIRRLRNDGCDIVGMTGMPEAGLARELQLTYACLALVVNRAAGLGESTISLDEMNAVLQAGSAVLRRVLAHTIASLTSSQPSSALV
jgi:5'-methylthioinosine phosphorylase